MTIIHVWHDDGILPNQWAVSLCDDDGTEARFLDGFVHRSTAIEWGEYEADRRGIPMEVLHERTGEVIARYEPGGDDVEVDLDGAPLPRVLYGVDHDHDEVEFEVPAGWEVDWSSAHRISAPHTTPVRYAAYLLDRGCKRDVSSWTEAATFVATYDDSDSSGEWCDGACDVSVEIGCAGARWFVRTRDDAGGSDDCDDTAYPSEDAARAAAQEYAEDHHEADDGEDAAAYLDRRLQEQIGPQDRSGAWGVYWRTRGEGSRVVERYSTRDAAEAACARATREFNATYPGGNYLCCYEVRVRLDGKWVPADDEHPEVSA